MAAAMPMPKKPAVTTFDINKSPFYRAVELFQTRSFLGNERETRVEIFKLFLQCTKDHNLPAAFYLEHILEIDPSLATEVVEDETFLKGLRDYIAKIPAIDNDHPRYWLYASCRIIDLKKTTKPKEQLRLIQELDGLASAAPNARVFLLDFHTKAGKTSRKYIELVKSWGKNPDLYYLFHSRRFPDIGESRAKTREKAAAEAALVDADAEVDIEAEWQTVCKLSGFIVTDGKIESILSDLYCAKEGGTSTLKRNPDRGFFWGSTSAFMGNKSKQFMLSTYFTLKVQWLPIAADKGERRAQIQYANVLYKVNKNPNAAVHFLKLAFQKGRTDFIPPNELAHGAFLLGEIHEQGCEAAPKDDREALVWYERAVEIARNPYALNHIAKFFNKGLGGKEKNKRECLNYCEQALAVCMETGDNIDLALGMIKNIIGIYLEGGDSNVPKNYPKAIEYLRRELLLLRDKTESKKECARCQFEMARLYWDGGYGLEQDRKTAMELFKEASNHNVEAMFYYGRALLEGELGVEKNVSAGIQMLVVAANQGDVQAMWHLCCAWDKGERKDFELHGLTFSKIAEYLNFLKTSTKVSGEFRKIFDDVLCLYYWRCGDLDSDSGADFKKLFEHARVGAEQMQPAATIALAWIYEKDRSVLNLSADLRKSMDLYRVAIDSDSLITKDAMLSLGILLSKGGPGITKDPLAGEEWCKKAYAAGNFTAGIVLVKWYVEGKVVKKNLPRALDLLREVEGSIERLSKSERANLFAHLGDFYELYADTPNHELACEYYEKAVAAGSKKAVYFYVKLRLKNLIDSEEFPTSELEALLKHLEDGVSQGHVNSIFLRGMIRLILNLDEELPKIKKEFRAIFPKKRPVIIKKALDYFDEFEEITDADVILLLTETHPIHKRQELDLKLKDERRGAAKRGEATAGERKRAVERDQPKAPSGEKMKRLLRDLKFFTDPRLKKQIKLDAFKALMGRFSLCSDFNMVFEMRPAMGGGSGIRFSMSSLATDPGRGEAPAVLFMHGMHGDKKDKQLCPARVGEVQDMAAAVEGMVRTRVAPTSAVASPARP